MPLIDKATFIPGGGNYYTAAVGTAFPANLLAPGEDWTNLGHTSLEDILGFSSEGGDKSVLGSLQAKALRTKYSPRTDSLAVNLLQFDVNSLRLYFGSNLVDVNSDGKLYGVPQNPAPTEKAVLAVFEDGGEAFGVYMPRAEIFRGEDLEISDAENLAQLPLSITPLVHGENKWAFAVTPLGVATDPLP